MRIILVLKMHEVHVAIMQLIRYYSEKIYLPDPEKISLILCQTVCLLHVCLSVSKLLMFDFSSDPYLTLTQSIFWLPDLD